MNLSRRSFVAGLAGLELARALERQAPSLILHSGNVWTVEPDYPRAEAIAIIADRIAAIGANDEILPLATGGTRKIDLGKKTVLPGFIDAHAHPAPSGRDHLHMAACDLNTIAQVTAALRKRAMNTPPGEWVLGFLYDDSKTEHSLTRQDIDEYVPDHPVLVTHRGGHTGFANSPAFAAAGITDSTPDPPGGRFDRDASGHLSGRVADNAMAMIQKFIPEHESRADYREGMKLISTMMTSKGITSACDADCSPEDLQAWQDAHDAGELKMRGYCLMSVRALDRMIAAGIHTGFGDEWVRVGGIKQYADGSISERTARLAQPYDGMPDYYGLFLSSEEELYERGRKARLAGWQLATHANGDVAIDRILTVYERLQREMPARDPRYRIEHCTMINDSLVRRMRALNVIPVPFSCYVYYHGEKMHFYGEDRLKRMFAMRSFLDAGLRPPDSSDYTASPADPMMWLQSQVTRTDTAGRVWGANQRITVEEAIRCATINGAYASFEEHLKGSLAPGKLADLVVLGRDPFREPPSSLATIPVERTMVGGKWVFES